MKFHNKKIEKINIFFLLGISTGFVHLLQKKKKMFWTYRIVLEEKKNHKSHFITLLFSYLFLRGGGTSKLERIEILNLWYQNSSHLFWAKQMDILYLIWKW